MICTCCYKSNMSEAITDLDGIGTVPCLKCPICGHILFTQQHSEVIDRIRIKNEALKMIDNITKYHECNYADMHVKLGELRALIEKLRTDT